MLTPLAGFDVILLQDLHDTFPTSMHLESQEGLCAFNKGDFKAAQQVRNNLTPTHSNCSLSC